MTTTEHLARSIAGWRSTIAAIDYIKILKETGGFSDKLAYPILAAWPEELL
jgi:hypothetical protein